MSCTLTKSTLCLLLLLSFGISCGQIDNPCADRIDYSQNEINDGIDLDTLFASPTNAELQTVITMWDSFDMASTSVQQIETFTTTLSAKKRRVHVVMHVAEERQHYGGILLPLNYDSTQTYPLMIWAEGLSQDNPLVNLENGYGLGFGNLLPDHFVLVPSFRGQSLKTRSSTYCSDGFFGDAYDGATDDALRFMQVAFGLFNTSINKERLSIYGGSRGGTVALLAGIRYPLLRKVISQSGPTQFHHRFCYDRYGFQFRYQFLNQQKSINDIRQKLIKCSPIYFIDNYINDLYIVHGKNDPIVPIWNAQTIIDARGEGNKLTYLFTEDGHGVSASAEVAKWIRDW